MTIRFYLNNELSAFFQKDSETLFDLLFSLKGKVFRKVEKRCTKMVTINEKNYFIKQHFGVGWIEILKNMFQGRAPVTSAQNEYHALMRLQQLNIDAPRIAAYGSKGYNPAYLRSFILLEALPESAVSLEDYCKNWTMLQKSTHLQVRKNHILEKRWLLGKLASIARVMHQNGINHRDFYLCHFYLDLNDKKKVYLIDLHRAQIRRKIPLRWIIKDLAGLYFSTKEIGLSQRDLLRFIKAYSNCDQTFLQGSVINKSLREILTNENVFWKKVLQRGNKLYQQHI